MLPECSKPHTLPCRFCETLEAGCPLGRFVTVAHQFGDAMARPIGASGASTIGPLNELIQRVSAQFQIGQECSMGSPLAVVGLAGRMP